MAVFRDHALGKIFPTTPYAHDWSSENTRDKEFTLSFLFRLQALILSCLDGRSAIDTLFTCLPLHYPDLVKNRLLKWIASVSLTNLAMIVDTISTMRIVRTDEFSPSIYSMVDPWRADCEELLEAWQKSHSTVSLSADNGSFSYRPILFLLSFNNFLTMLINGHLDYAHMRVALQTSVATIKNDPGDPYQACSDEEMLIFPRLSNLYCTGCVRRPVELMGSKEVVVSWITFMSKLDDVVAFYETSPPIEKVLQLFLTLAGDLNTPLPFSAAFRSMMLALFWRGKLVYGTWSFPSFVQSSFTLSSPMEDPRVFGLLDQVLRVASHTLPRQRRMLPDLLNTLSMVPSLGSLALYLAQWYVILGFGLELYSPYEASEAHWLLIRLCKTNSLLQMMATCLMQHHFAPPAFSVYEEQRIQHRWSPLIPYLGGEKSVLDTMFFELSTVAPRLSKEETVPLTNRQCYDRYLMLFLEQSCIHLS